VDDVSWAALTLSLTVLGGIWTWFAFRRRGLASGVRGVGFTLLPLAAYLTHTLRMFTRMVDAVGDWATGLVWSPRVWSGLIVLAVAVLCLLLARFLGARSPRTTAGPETPREVRAAERGQPAVQDDDMADIEALLRRRGIS
jgi:hypothetical protein